MDHLTFEVTTTLSNGGNHHPKTQHHFQEDLNSQQDHCENFKPCKVSQFMQKPTITVFTGVFHSVTHL
jgi:hypothetical protein